MDSLFGRKSRRIEELESKASSQERYTQRLIEHNIDDIKKILALADNEIDRLTQKFGNYFQSQKEQNVKLLQLTTEPVSYDTLYLYTLRRDTDELLDTLATIRCILEHDGISLYEKWLDDPRNQPHGGPRIHLSARDADIAPFLFSGARESLAASKKAYEENNLRAAISRFVQTKELIEQRCDFYKLTPP